MCQSSILCTGCPLVEIILSKGFTQVQLILVHRSEQPNLMESVVKINLHFGLTLFKVMLEPCNKQLEILTKQHDTLSWVDFQSG